MPPNQSPQQYPHLLIDPKGLDSIPMDQLITAQILNQTTRNPNPTQAGRKNINKKIKGKQRQKNVGRPTRFEACNFFTRPKLNLIGLSIMLNLTFQ